MQTTTLLTLLATFLGLSQAFVAQNNGNTNQARKANLYMAPKYDKSTSRWTPSSPEEGPDAGYGPLKSLLLQGPKPFLTRVFSPDDYDQGVLKFMAGEWPITREEAQGSFDRYLENAQDWALERMEADKKGKPYPPYHVLNPKALSLTLVWSSIVAVFGGRAVYSLATGEYYWQFIVDILYK